MTVFDKRHRWGPVVMGGSTVSRTCKACGRTDTYETVIPDGFAEAVAANLARPNIWRDLFRR